MYKVLIIDDNETLLYTLQAFLEDNNYEVHSATNGHDGLELFAKFKPELVLTDLHMPGLSGLEVLSKIHEMDPQIPVIIISGAGELPDAIQALRRGAWDFITKPINDLVEFARTIHSALERKKIYKDNQQEAMENAKTLSILQQDQAAGRQLQVALLPPEHFSAGGFAIDYHINPSLELSGDFVEYFKITDNHYGIYIADVAGHGTASAFMTILLKTLINQHLVRYQINGDRTILSADLLLASLNDQLCSSKTRNFITINYSVLDFSNGNLNYAVAGHYPHSILLQADATLKFLPEVGYPLGVREGVKYQAQTLTLKPGDKLVLFSDGVLELFVQQQSLEAKEQQLLDIVAKQQGKISAICQTIDALRSSATTNIDDITVLTISHNP